MCNMPFPTTKSALDLSTTRYIRISATSPVSTQSGVSDYESRPSTAESEELTLRLLPRKRRNGGDATEFRIEEFVTARRTGERTSLTERERDRGTTACSCGAGKRQRLVAATPSAISPTPPGTPPAATPFAGAPGADPLSPDPYAASSEHFVNDRQRDAFLWLCEQGAVRTGGVRGHPLPAKAIGAMVEAAFEIGGRRVIGAWRGIFAAWRQHRIFPLDRLVRGSGGAEQAEQRRGWLDSLAPPEKEALVRFASIWDRQSAKEAQEALYTMFDLRNRAKLYRSYTDAQSVATSTNGQREKEVAKARMFWAVYGYYRPSKDDATATTGRRDPRKQKWTEFKNALALAKRCYGLEAAFGSGVWALVLLSPHYIKRTIGTERVFGVWMDAIARFNPSVPSLAKAAKPFVDDITNGRAPPPQYLYLECNGDPLPSREYYQEKPWFAFANADDNAVGGVIEDHLDRSGPVLPDPDLVARSEGDGDEGAEEDGESEREDEEENGPEEEDENEGEGGVENQFRQFSDSLFHSSYSASTEYNDDRDPIQWLSFPTP